MADIAQTSLSILASATVAIIVATGGFFYYQYDQAKNELILVKNETKKVSQETSKDILDEIAKLIELPKKETPSISAMTNIGDLKDFNAFKNVENGDVIISYYENNKTIIYRPATNKIVEIYNQNLAELYNKTNEYPEIAGIGSIQADNESQLPETVELTITIINGTKTVGLAGKIADQVSDILRQSYTIDKIIKSDAKELYDKTYISGVTYIGKQEIQNLAKITGFSIIEVPQNEDFPNTDILIIAGNDLAESN